MITGNVSAQFIGNGRVQVRMNETANSKRGAAGQICATDFAQFNNDNAAMHYTNLVNSTGVLFGPKDSHQLLDDVFQSASKE